MTTKVYYIGWDWREERIRKYDSEQDAQDNASNYQIIECTGYKEAVEIYKENHYREPENRDL